MHNSDIQITVIVPVYNVEGYVEKCLESIVRQTRPHLEIILVDDGSTDSSGSICDAYALKDHRIQVIHKENGGLVSARKAGIKAATGDYISFVDSDDWVDLDMFENLLTRCENNLPDIIAFGCIEEFSYKQNMLGNSIAEGLYKDDKLEKLKSNILMGDTFFTWRILPHLCDKLIRRKLLLSNLEQVSSEISFGEDMACTFPCIFEAKSLLSLDYYPYHYWQREGSIVRQYSEIKETNFIEIYKRINKYARFDTSLSEQLKLYMWFIILLKSYSKIPQKKDLFPYGGVFQNKKVIIYGAGGFGKVIRNYIDSTEIKLAGWVDLYADEYQKQGLDVAPVEILSETDFDYIVVSVLNEKISMSIRDDLVQRGIKSSKIMLIDSKYLLENDLPDWLFKRGAGKR